ncbi:MAG TPA: RluA family pseudouridine synthase [Thermoanaerobaculia bacterium]
MRLDQAIAARYPELSRRKARELIAAKRVLVNERLVAVASRDVSDGDRIAIVDADPQLDVIRETPEWVAINKPAGMPAQPPRDRATRSAEELLRAKYREIYLVHRIDTPTSGIVLFARTRKTAAALSKLFADGAMKKTYVALVAGTIEPMTIETPIDGKEAITIVRPHDRLVECEIKTGRTHQIRVHLASVGHAVVGDRRYGGPQAPRLMLHAWKLEHASIGILEAPIPIDFAP